LKSVAVHPASLDAPLGDTADGSSLGEVVRDENAASPLETLGDRNLSAELKLVVGSLDEREAEIIRLRFGLDGRKEMTLAEVGRKFKVTRERIRQLQQYALKEMRKMMQKRGGQRSAEEIAEDDRIEVRSQVLREFASQVRKPAAA
jgi:RNA polymerase primary sigma factor